MRHCGRQRCGTMATWVIDGSGAGGTEPRRRFSEDDKARIVSEAMMPGASVLDVARRHRVCTSLVYRWRRVLLRDGVAVEAPQLPAPAFVPVEVASAPTPAQPEPLGPGVVEVVGSGRAAHPACAAHRRAGAQGRAGRVRVIGPPAGVRVYLAAGITDMRNYAERLGRVRHRPAGGCGDRRSGHPPDRTGLIALTQRPRSRV